MTPKADLNYREEISSQQINRWLTKSLYVLTIMAVVLVVVQIALIFVLASQCTTIKGVTLGGTIFKTSSFSCPQPGVEKIF